MTMPTLIQNHQKHQTIVQLRKVYSDLSNATKRSEIDNGPMSGWDYPNCDTAANVQQCLIPFLEHYWLPYFESPILYDRVTFVNKTGYSYDPKGGYNFGIINRYIVLNNGVILSFYTNGTNLSGSGYLWLFADVNGEKGPNRVGRDIFRFNAARKLVLADGKSTVQQLKQGQYGCNKENKDNYRNFSCGALIEVNNWEIPDDYPW